MSAPERDGFVVFERKTGKEVEFLSYPWTEGRATALRYHEANYDVEEYSVWDTRVL